MISRISKPATISWMVAYVSLFFAGIVAFFAPSRVVATTLIEVLVYGWASFLTVGAGICLAGKIKGDWTGEIIGLPLLSAANYIFGILLLFRGTSPAAIAIGGIFFGFGTAFIARWIELRTLAKKNIGVNSESGS